MPLDMFVELSKTIAMFDSFVFSDYVNVIAKAHAIKIEPNDLEQYINLIISASYKLSKSGGDSNA